MEEELLKTIIIQGNSITNLLESNRESANLRFAYFGGISLASTALGAFLAYCVGHLSHKRHLKPESAKSFIKLLSKFEEQCLEYWSKTHDPKESLIEEAKIKAGHKQLRLYAEYGNFGLKASKKKHLEKLISKLFDEATGGDFESKKRQASRTRIQKIAMITTSIAPILIEKSFE
tara:strand:+ start:372 stop:896 length:525 start_codon:yes stop_codon:yes gene_type:complete